MHELIYFIKEIALIGRCLVSKSMKELETSCLFKKSCQEKNGIFYEYPFTFGTKGYNKEDSIGA